MPSKGGSDSTHHKKRGDVSWHANDGSWQVPKVQQKAAHVHFSVNIPESYLTCSLRPEDFRGVEFGGYAI
jgi:hypothetical protein